jgi:hypothetical protein
MLSAGLRTPAGLVQDMRVLREDAIHAHGEGAVSPQVPARDAAGGQESEACDLGAEDRQAPSARVLDAALGDDVAELPILAPVVQRGYGGSFPIRLKGGEGLRRARGTHH